MKTQYGHSGLNLESQFQCMSCQKSKAKLTQGGYIILVVAQLLLKAG